MTASRAPEFHISLSLDATDVCRYRVPCARRVHRLGFFWWVLLAGWVSLFLVQQATVRATAYRKRMESIEQLSRSGELRRRTRPT